MQPDPSRVAETPESSRAAFSRTLSTLAEDAIFACSAGFDTAEALVGMGKRRQEAYLATFKGAGVARIGDAQEAWVMEMTRALAPISAPMWMPMGDVLRERITLEAGARGLRSLFSSKPSEKDVARVVRLGSFAARVLRTMFAADGKLDTEEVHLVATFIASLGLPDSVATPLHGEGVRAPENLEDPGDVEASVARAIVRGAWHAAAWSAPHPESERIARWVAAKLGVSVDTAEELRSQADLRVTAQRTVGVAIVESMRYVLSDQSPTPDLAKLVSEFLVPRRYRDEATTVLARETPILAAKRYATLPVESRNAILATCWAAALREDPTMSRKTVLRWRYERLATEIGDDGKEPRRRVEDFVDDSMASLARSLSGLG